jgi:haloacetate dehalogenase
MFEGFSDVSASIDGVNIHAVKGGSGPALLLLHGHPQTHVIWHKVVPSLTKHFTVVAADLRGYGDSGKPEASPDHSNHSKRRMALDQVGLMRHLGFESFLLMGHDRGARVAARLTLDHPDAVQRLVTLDIAPTLSVYENTSFESAQAYWHWYFLVRPAPFPEAFIQAEPKLFLDHSLLVGGAERSHFADAAYAEYLRCFVNPDIARGVCEDYRAGISIDIEHDKATLASDHRINCPFLVLWGEKNKVFQRINPLVEWRNYAPQATGGALPSGHFIPEEIPDMLLDQVLPFLRA